jgi:hypothetical protein
MFCGSIDHVGKEVALGCADVVIVALKGEYN